MLDRALTTRCYFKQLGPKESLPKERKKESKKKNNTEIGGCACEASDHISS